MELRQAYDHSAVANCVDACLRALSPPLSTQETQKLIPGDSASTTIKRTGLTVCGSVRVESFDLLVIGSGPAGEKGAAQAAYFGKRVALIERRAELGGAGINTGTVPSKTT